MKRMLILVLALWGLVGGVTAPAKTRGAPTLA
jgi:hypothetical protein